MAIITQELSVHGQTLILHPSGALYWQETDMLLIADVHLGKVNHFRKHGSAVPNAAIQGNFTQLDSVVAFFEPAVICFLGDLFHSYINSEWELFVNWVHKQTAKLVLVAGNHDIINPMRFEELAIQVTDEWCIGTILLTHHPEVRANLFNIAGHIHPGIRLRGLGKQNLTIPCFHKKEQQLVVPAFGTFTGKFIITPSSEDVIFAITKEEVVRVALE